MAKPKVSKSKSLKKSPTSLKGKETKAKKELGVSAKASKPKKASVKPAPKAKAKPAPKSKTTKKSKVDTKSRKVAESKVTKKKATTAKVKAIKSSVKETKKKIIKTEEVKKPIRKTRVIASASKAVDISKGKTKFGKDITERQRTSTRYRKKSAEKPSPQAQALLTPTEKMLKPFKDAAKKNQVLQKSKQKEAKLKGFLAKPQATGKKVTVDLRMHSPMSEGYFSTGGVDPAGAMIRLAKAKGLDMIAVTDYNSAEFLELIQDKAKETSVSVLPGLDLRCQVAECDEIYFVALFEEEKTSTDLYRVLAEIGVPLSARGSKNFVVKKSLKEIIEVVEREGGILIPSRVDKTPNRLHAAKTLVEDFGFHAFDMVHPDNPEYFKDRWPSGEFTFFSFSNANSLGQVGSRTFSTKIPKDGFKGLKAVIDRRKAV